mgnify:CR=1 FL=1
MRFRYVGKEMTEWFGKQWMHGIEHDIDDPHAIAKLSNSALVETVGDLAGTQTAEPKRRGRLRKEHNGEPNDDAAST